MMKKIRLASIGLALVAMVSTALVSSVMAQDALTVTEIQLATQLENGQAVSPATTFSRSAGRIYAVIRVQNPSRTETTIRARLVRADSEGAGAGGIELSIPAQPRDRTVARFGTSAPAGRYRVVVTNAAGEVIGQQELELTE
ncbi:hypothetical protein ARNL5_02307 [Anaerolineae bacterium]|nr:hypothetical protein ARNL5_02307 [Anaerolineae bacterium]